MNFGDFLKPINEPSRKTVFLLLGVLTIINLGLHLWGISYPGTPAFDEAHFASYAADYVKDRAYFDIHPPLGKMIYGAALELSGNPAAGAADYITIVANKDKKTFGTVAAHYPFGDFPYILLRCVSILFGLLLPLVLFWFLRSIDIGRIGAFFGAMFIVLDNAILLETKLILMNGMFLVFGLVALAVFFSKKQSFWQAGLFFGLALSVKLTAVCFFAPVLIFALLSGEKKRQLRRLGKILLISFAVLFGFYLLNFALFPLSGHAAILNIPSQSMGIGNLFNPSKGFLSVAVIFLVDVLLSAAGYIGGIGAPAHLQQSPWYAWPIGEKPMFYHYPVGDPGGIMMLVANRVLWLFVVLAFISAIVILPGYAKKHLGEAYKQKALQLYILLGGYICSLLPYFTAVNRSTFLYHYFPALIFGIGILAWMIENKFKNWPAVTLIFALVLIGFISQLGCVYGVRCF